MERKQAVAMVVKVMENGGYEDAESLAEAILSTLEDMGMQPPLTLVDTGRMDLPAIPVSEWH